MVKAQLMLLPTGDRFVICINCPEPDKITLVHNSKNLKSGKAAKNAAMIGVEGGHMIEDRMDYIDSLAKRGMNYLTLTWNNSTSWATSARDEVTKKIH